MKRRSFDSTPRLVSKSVGGARTRPQDAWLKRSGRTGQQAEQQRAWSQQMAALDSLRGSGWAERRVFAEKLRELVPVLVWDAKAGALTTDLGKAAALAHQWYQRCVTPFGNLLLKESPLVAPVNERNEFHDRLAARLADAWGARFRSER